MRLFALACGVALLAALWRGPALHAYPSGPPPATTGGFGEGTCVKCHDSNELNVGQRRNLGELKLAGFPPAYEPGKSYGVTVELTQAQDSGVWGFQLAARAAQGGAQAGELRPMDAHTRVAVEKGVQYVQHTADGTFFATFEFNWVAPVAAVGPVAIHVAGNAANGDVSPKGDYIYTASLTIPPAAK